MDSDDFAKWKKIAKTKMGTTENILVMMTDSSHESCDEFFKIKMLQTENSESKKGSENPKNIL